MVRRKLGMGVTGVVVGLLFLWWWDHRAIQRYAARQEAALVQERDELAGFVEHLSATRRVAQMIITDQHPDDGGRTITTILWQEVGDDGALSAPQEIDVYGQCVFVQGCIIKFEPSDVAKGVAGREHSLVAFERLFGEQQSPESGTKLELATPPAPSASGPGRTPAAADLWKRFWEMIEDRRLAEQFHVRVVQCEAPSVSVDAGDVWEVSLDANGGLNLVKLRDAQE